MTELNSAYQEKCKLLHVVDLEDIWTGADASSCYLTLVFDNTDRVRGLFTWRQNAAGEPIWEFKLSAQTRRAAY